MSPNKSCFIVIAIILIISLLVIFVSRCATYTTMGKLKVNSDISEVNVILGDATYKTPFEIELKKGHYTMQAYKSGYLIKEISTDVKPRQTTTIDIGLTEDPTDKQIPEGAP